MLSVETLIAVNSSSNYFDNTNINQFYNKKKCLEIVL